MVGEVKANRLYENDMTHPRQNLAHWPESLTALGASQACPPCLSSAANQLSFQDDSRPCRPWERAVRFATVPSPIGGFTGKRPAFSLRSFPSHGPGKLLARLCSGARELRSLAPGLQNKSAKQHCFFDLLEARFLSSSPCPDTRLRWKRIGFIMRRHPSSPDLLNPIRRSDVTQDSDFRTKSPSTEKRCFSSPPPGVRHPSERQATLRNFPSNPQNEPQTP